MSLLFRFARNQSGATAIEYGLVATLIGIAVIVGGAALGTKLNAVFNGVADKLVIPT